MSDNDKCKLLNLKEELEVFLVNQSVTFSKVQESVRKELEDSLAFFKRQDCVIRESKTLEASEEAVKEACTRIQQVRKVRISTLYHKHLVLLCESWATRSLTLHSVFGKPYLTQEVLATEQIIQKLENDWKKPKPILLLESFLPSWKLLLKDLRKASLLPSITFKEFERFKERINIYEHDLLCLRHKNEYRDAMYMEFYKIATRVNDNERDAETNRVAEKYSFYHQLNEYEKSLRTKIAELTDLTIQIENIKTNAQNDSIFVRRGGPKHCPGSGSGSHQCSAKTKFFPALDQVERCRLCHEAFVLQVGGRIQNKRKAKSKNTEPLKVKLFVR